jgi:hypothetical protein
MEDINRIAAVHNPVQVYRGKNGRLIAFPSCAKQATNANTGPVDPIIVKGWAENSA